MTENGQNLAKLNGLKNVRNTKTAERGSDENRDRRNNMADTVTETLNRMVGEKVIIRTQSAGCWFGTLIEKARNEVILANARRMWYWRASEGISLSACALYGVDQKKSKIVEPVETVWLEAIEIIHCSHVAIKSLEGAPHVEAEET